MTEKPTYEKYCQRFKKDSKRVFARNKWFFFQNPAVFFVIFFLLGSIKPVFAFELSAAEQAYLNTKGTIVFVSQTRYPPFEFIDKNKEHTGMSIELARWIATEFGFTAKFTDTYFKKAQQDILSGRADVLTSFFYSKKRDESFDFTQPMFEVPALIFVVAERTDIKDIQDLNGKRIAMQVGDYAKEFLESKEIKCDIVSAKNFDEATDLVIAGKADAVIGDEQIVLYHIYKDNLTEKIKTVGDPLYIGQNCMATKDANQMLISILDKGIKMAKQSGVLEKINRKWIGIHYTPRESLIFKYLTHLYVAVGTIFLLVLLIWTWNVRLRQAVRDRTEKLKKSEELLKATIESTADGILVVNEKGQVTHANKRFAQIWNIPNELIETRDDKKLLSHVLNQLLYPEKFLSKVQQLYNLADEDFDTIHFKNGQILERYSCPLMRNGKLTGRVWSFRDITERRRSEEQVKASLKEKDILLKEIHHRVKNNMQIISSLMKIQASHTKDKLEVEMYKESQDRITSMSLIHDQLYRSENLSNIDFGEYIKQLVYNLQDSFRPDAEKIEVNIDAKDIFLSIDAAIPLGLIANELLSNSFKYAFPADREGTITIVLQLADDNTIELIIGDNGIGIPKGIDFKHSDTLGLQLITNIAEHQLFGEVELKRDGGTEFCIRFKSHKFRH